MKKYILIFIELVLFFSIISSCSQGFKQKLEATLFWETKVMPVFQLDIHPCITMNIHTIFSDTTDCPEVSIVRTEFFKAYLDEDWEEYYLFTDDSVWMVNVRDCELMQGKKGNCFYDVWHDQTIYLPARYIQPFLYPNKVKYQFDNIRDSIINGVKYKVLRREVKNSFSFNQATNEYDIPDFHIVDYYFNTSIKLIDYICAIPTPESVDSRKEEFYLSYSFENTTKKIHQIFDFDNPQYVNYSMHDDDNLPLSWGSEDSVSSSLSKKVLDFPIVSLSGDTTSIAKENDWLLLDLWHFSCKPCITWIAQISQERESDKQCFLESNGIKIMSINAVSNNQEKLTETAKKYNAADIIYHAKGLGKVIDMRFTPQFYLISPNKEIVLKTNDLGDYSEVLKAKQEWESKHKRK